LGLQQKNLRGKSAIHIASPKSGLYQGGLYRGFAFGRVGFCSGMTFML
jgi:hypothetical protein